MTDEGTYAVGYRLEINELSALQTVGVTFAWAVQSSQGLTIAAPRKWRCRLPNPAEYVETYFGTSETKGILGGVAQPLLAAQSEAAERVLGDALTIAFAEIMDWGGPEASTVMILGPAFPKVLGRFMSLRPPKTTGIFWITPVSVPPAVEHMWHLLLPLQAGTGPAMAWSNEVLLNHLAYPNAERPTYWVQFIDTREVRSRIGSIHEVLNLPTVRKDRLKETQREANILLGVDLPRQLRLALDVTETEGAANMPTEVYGGAKLLRLTQGPPLEYISAIPSSKVQVYQWKPDAFG